MGHYDKQREEQAKREKHYIQMMNHGEIRMMERQLEADPLKEIMNEIKEEIKKIREILNEYK